MCMFCRLLFVLLFFFFWPLCCLFFCDIRILITPLETLLTFPDIDIRILFAPLVSSSSSFVLFLLAIVLSVLLRYTDADYPFGIFKLFVMCSVIVRCVDIGGIVDNLSLLKIFKLSFHIKKRKKKKRANSSRSEYFQLVIRIQ